MPRPWTRPPCSDCGGPSRINRWKMNEGAGITIACRRCDRETNLYLAEHAHLAEAEWGRLNAQKDNVPALLLALRGLPVVILLRGPTSGCFRGRLDEDEPDQYEVSLAEGQVIRFRAGGCRAVEGRTIMLGRQ